MAVGLTAEPRSAYLHVPFCAHRCGYCNFTLITGRDDLVEPYLQAIERELSWLERPREVDTLFFGGGTPTYLRPDQISRLFQTALHWFPLAAGAEFSIEANPADINEELAATLVAHGVTRVSLGAQSFYGPKLAQLERNHDAGDTPRAVELLRERDLSVSLDLIFATPGETLDVWRADLEAAIALEPQHVSTYGLTFEKGTSFWSRLQHAGLARLDEDVERQMYACAIDTLTAADFEHYEVSNFARPGHRCKHNEVYWSGAGYYAAGPGAARYVSGRREMNHRSTSTWLKRVLAGQSPVADWEELLPEDRARETLVFALRRLEGVDRDEFREHTGYDIDALVGEPLGRFTELGLLEHQDGRIRLTREGLFISDAIWPEFLRV